MGTPEWGSARIKSKRLRAVSADETTHIAQGSQAPTRLTSSSVLPRLGSLAPNVINAPTGSSCQSLKNNHFSTRHSVSLGCRLGGGRVVHRDRTPGNSQQMVSSSGSCLPRNATGTCDLAQLARPPLVVHLD